MRLFTSAVSKCFLDLIGATRVAQKARSDGPDARPERTELWYLAHARAGAGRDESESRAHTFITLLDLRLSHIARPSGNNCDLREDDVMLRRAAMCRATVQLMRKSVGTILGDVKMAGV